MTRWEQVTLASIALTVLCATLFLTHAVAFRLGENAARAQAAELFLTLDEASRLHLAYERVFDGVEQDIRFCHDRLAKLQVMARPMR